MTAKNHPRKMIGKQRQFHCYIDPLLKAYREFIKSELAALLCHLGSDCPGTRVHSTLLHPSGEILVFTSFVKGDRVAVIHPITESQIMNGTFFVSELLADGNFNWPADGSLPGGRN